MPFLMELKMVNLLKSTSYKSSHKKSRDILQQLRQVWQFTYRQHDNTRQDPYPPSNQKRYRGNGIVTEKPF